MYQYSFTDGKKFRYTYDYAGRLLNTSFNYMPNVAPEDYMIFSSYTYNQNSQIKSSKFDPINLTHSYSYDNRSRITDFSSDGRDLFSYNLTYFSNSNIQTQNEFPSPITSDDTPTGWTIILDEYYARDVTGKEIAIYSSYTLQYWNVWSGGEITGRINYSESLGRNYYLKDHLGSIRVVLDEDKSIVSANDLDMWGYYLQV